MDEVTFRKIKRLTLTAIVSDDQLMERLILKGGNALDLIYNVASRASLDLDFSMKDRFDDEELPALEVKVAGLLQRAFAPVGLVAHDTKLKKRPATVRQDVEDYWGGYRITFKLIPAAKRELFGRDAESLRRNSIQLGIRASTNFQIDISCHEYCEAPEEKLLDNYQILVYSPTLIAIEKLRAICQQMNEYRAIVPSLTPTARARDFFDIHCIITKCGVDLLTPGNRSMIEVVFGAKRVPTELLAKLESYREFHRADFPALKDTVKPGEELADFDFYFDFVASICRQL